MLSKKRNCTHINKHSVKKKIHRFLDDWDKAASEANFEAYYSKMDTASVFIGTDAAENWTKKQFENFSKPYFDKGKASSFVALERNIYTNDAHNFIWFFTPFLKLPKY
ncbi:MAG: nuclear transport factor 2 family protein [Polaribacter sp.]|nr:nuclear transport factor 2 family protein [Polaribacter sp.]